MQTEMMYIKQMRPHFHEDELEIIFVLQGSIVVHKMERSVALKEGEMTFINRRIVHYVESDGAYVLSSKIRLAAFKDIFNRIEYVEFYHDENADDVMKKRKSMVIVDAIIRDFQIQYQESLANQKAFNENQLVFMLFSKYQLVSAQKKEEYTTEDLQNRYYFIVEYIFEHIEEKIVIEDILKHVYMNSTYFSQFMKKVGGVGFKEFVSYRKLTTILTYLIDRKYAMTEIGNAVGMRDMKSFYSVFKRYFGVSPAKWREQVSTINDDYVLCHDDYILSHFIETYHIHRHRDNTIAKLYQTLIVYQQKGILLEGKIIVLNPYQDMGEDLDEDYQVYKYFGALIHLIRLLKGEFALLLPYPYLKEQLQKDLFMTIINDSLLQYGLNEIKKWKIVMVVDQLSELEKAVALQEELEKKMGGLELELSLFPR